MLHPPPPKKKEIKKYGWTPASPKWIYTRSTGFQIRESKVGRFEWKPKTIDPCCWQLVRGLLGTGPPPPSNPPRPPLLSGQFGIEIGSNQDIDVKSMSNRCRIDAKSTPEEGKARQIRGCGRGGLCLISPSQTCTFSKVFEAIVVCVSSKYAFGG